MPKTIVTVHKWANGFDFTVEVPGLLKDYLTSRLWKTRRAAVSNARKYVERYLKPGTYIKQETGD